MKKIVMYFSTYAPSASAHLTKRCSNFLKQSGKFFWRLAMQALTCLQVDVKSAQ